MYRRRTERFCSMRSYILGWVKLGSSPSLWPRRRYATRSITTSPPKRWRYSNARRPTRATASGSSPLTWKIGALIAFATSVQYVEERDSDGAVVKPTWLLTTMWIVPPVL